MSKKNSKKAFLLIFIGLVIAGLGGTYLYFAERHIPKLIVSPDNGTIGHKKSIQIEVSDKGSGLSSLLVKARQNSTQVVLLNRDFQGDLRSWQYPFDLSETP